MSSLIFQNSVGSGAGFPITLTNFAAEGEPERLGWAVSEADPDLIRQSLSSILVYHITDEFRQEHFGTRMWEVLENPNTKAVDFLLRLFIKDGIKMWEPRVELIRISSRQDGPTTNIFITYQIRNTTNVYELNFSYNPNVENSNL